MEKQTLYIPMGVKTKSEIFEGFGKKEVIQTVIATAVITAVAFLIYSVKRSVPLLIVLIMTGIAGTVMCLVKDANNQSVADHAKNMVRFMREQQVYKYRYLKEWGDL